MSRPHEDLHSRRMILSTRLDEVTDLDFIPTENEIHALLQIIHGLTVLLSRLETMPEFDHFEVLFQIFSLQDYLIRLHVEILLLRNECAHVVPSTRGSFFRWVRWPSQQRGTRLLPTRSLLEQQIVLRDKGMIVLSRLDDLKTSLQDLAAKSSGHESDGGKEGI